MMNRSVFDLSRASVWNLIYILIFVLVILAFLAIVFGIIATAKRNAEARKKYSSKPTEEDEKEDKQ